MFFIPMIEWSLEHKRWVLILLVIICSTLWGVERKIQGYQLAKRLCLEGKFK